MLAVLKDGREVEVSVRGTYEEPEITHAEYTSIHADGEPTEAEVQYIYDNYFSELSQEACEYQVTQAEYAFEGDR